MWNGESYSRQVRRVAREIRIALEPEHAPKQATRSDDVQTPAQSAEYHDVDESRFEVARIRTNTWGSTTNPNQQVRVDYKPREAGDMTPEEAAERFRELIANHNAPA